MAAKITAKSSPRQIGRLKRKLRIKKRQAPRRGEALRLVPFRSNRYLTVQLVDDNAGKTICWASTAEKSFVVSKRKSIEASKALGKLIAERALENKIGAVVFDRNGYDYHGRIKAIAEGAREGGLKF